VRLIRDEIEMRVRDLLRRLEVEAA
jgi:hypothetical protein